ncbi:cellulose biosynthesis protein BcsQ [Orrella marina]|uniref:Cellulose synthase operon protein YhjQ n=1 Tax=Orrella marina TaxID=2163011 RepID=A0A2R4XLZ4_9BURK|nr:cellulose biosynthesis protein BcsQ [Orrella marina]AWB34822.1 cellulose synthase operon protein YhjQ [Orrella marina]
MRAIGIQGLRGGVGTTSMVAMLADALLDSGQRVLVIDLNTSDMLRLHFNVSFEDPTGWAHGQQIGESWNEHAFEITQGLTLIPFGRFGLIDHDLSLQATAQTGSLNWLKDLVRLQPSPDWILIGVPCHLATQEALETVLDLRIVVASVDVACHILLAQTSWPARARLLANMQDPSRDLPNDLIVDWTARYHDRLLPVTVKRDECVHEALALMTPVTRAFPDCSASLDAQSLATWLQLHVKARP